MMAEGVVKPLSLAQPWPFFASSAALLSDLCG